jgi:hypothetical protein
MQMTETVVLDVPSLLTAAGVAASILAALYTRWAAASAKRQAESAEASLKEAKAQSALAHASLLAARGQNEIAVHGHRLAAYRALLVFRSEVVFSLSELSRKAAAELWEHARIAEFYYPPEVAAALIAITDDALKLHIIVDRLADSSNIEATELSRFRDRRAELILRIDDTVGRVNEDMRKVLRLFQSERPGG